MASLLFLMFICSFYIFCSPLLSHLLLNIHQAEWVTDPYKTICNRHLRYDKEEVLGKIQQKSTAFYSCLHRSQNVNSEQKKVFVQGIIYFIHSYKDSIEMDSESLPGPSLSLVRTDMDLLSCQPAQQSWKSTPGSSQRERLGPVIVADTAGRRYLSFSIFHPREEVVPLCLLPT